MCGIAGICGRWFQPGLTDRMVAAIAHRGPDGVGVFEDEGAHIGLGHARLAILDLTDRAQQPMRSQDERYVLSYNGEIYNFRELKSDLESKGERFTSTGDTELLLKGLIRYGPDYLERLNGIFAFAFWDCEKRELLVARDHMGVKPLYFSATDAGFAFASELKALLAIPGLSRNLDHKALHGYLAHLWGASPRTPLQAAEKVEPGMAMIVRDGRIARRWRYYEQPYGRPALAESEDEIAEALRDRLGEAVRRQMVSDVPLGAFLSGGLDSSAVVAFMVAAEGGAEIPCYTIESEEGGKDGFAADLPYARKVAQHLGTKLTELTIEPGSIERLPEMLYHLDEPQADPAPINALLISEQAQRDGLKVLMSGAGGDDVLSGYRRHRLLAMQERLRMLPRSIRQMLASAARAVADGDAGMRIASIPAIRRGLKGAVGVDEEGDRRLASYFLWGSETMRRSLYSPEMAGATADADASAPLLAALERIPGEKDPLNRLLFLDAQFFLADHNLNYTDKTGMAAGIETRVPLIDIDLLDYVTRIPARYKQKGAVGKSIFKKAMAGILPDDVIYRPKTGFGAPLRHWMRHDLSPMVDDVTSRRSLTERGLFDPKTVARLIELDRNGTVDASYTLFSLVCIELWCRIFVDGSPATAPTSPVNRVSA